MINRRNGAVARAVPPVPRRVATRRKKLRRGDETSDDVSKYTLDLIEFAGAGIVTHLAMDLGLAIITRRPVYITSPACGRLVLPATTPTVNSPARLGEELSTGAPRERQREREVERIG